MSSNHPAKLSLLEEEPLRALPAIEFPVSGTAEDPNVMALEISSTLLRFFLETLWTEHAVVSGRSIRGYASGDDRRDSRLDSNHRTFSRRSRNLRVKVCFAPAGSRYISRVAPRCCPYRKCSSFNGRFWGLALSTSTPSSLGTVSR